MRSVFLAAFAAVCIGGIEGNAGPAASSQDQPAVQRPNIIFVLADDLGYGDLGCYGQKKIKTPNIDRMAAEGMRFTNFYCGCSVCAPSRCTLMTGKHPGHATVRDNMQRRPGLEGQHPMEPGTVTVAQLLKKAGYATAIVGKWGLGMPEDHSSPLDFGFDHHYGYLCQGMAHTYYPPYLWRDDKQEPLAGNPAYSYGQRGVIEPSGKTYSHDLMAEDALCWVRQHKDGPLFLYLAFTIPHVSLQVPEDSLAEYRGKWPETPMTTSKHYANHAAPRAAYAAMITRMDRDVGRLLTLLKELGLDDRTLVFFASDNGAVFPVAGTDPEFFQSNGDLRGYKQDLYEGGIRTPLIARWPGRIKAGATSNLVGAFWDVLPTLCEIAGTPAPDDIDGLSIAPTLLGQAGQKQHEYLYWEYHSEGGAQAVRFGDWKAVRNNVKKAPDATPELYNLAGDASEKTNLAGRYPELAAKAAAYMKAAHRPSREPQWNFGPALAQNAPPQASAGQKRARYLELQQAILRDFAQKQYAQAQKKCLELIELAPKDPGGQYNLACAQARQGKTDQSLAALEKAVTLGFGDSQHLRADPDLEGLRKNPQFEAILRRAQTLEAEQAKGTYDKPSEMKGVKTVERQPEGGLRYHLRMPLEASKAKPARLVVWLHPSGGSGNRLAESLTMRLTRSGYALLVPNQKPWGGWSGEELKRLMEKSLPDAGQVEGIDPQKPILLGFSAGGQAALILWSSDPARLGGLVVDAAYPIRLEPGPNGGVRQATLSPPHSPAVKSVPVYALVGEADQGGRGLDIWRKVESAWRKAGVPLTIQAVPGKGHQWLIGPTEAGALEAWLKEINHPGAKP